MSIPSSGYSHEQSLAGCDYRDVLPQMTISDFVFQSQMIDGSDRDYVAKGIRTNLAVSVVGENLKLFGSALKSMILRGIIRDDIFSSTKVMTSCATDARMSGIGMPVMSSGGSGNQGIVAILCPYNVGKRMGIDEDRIIESIALSHLLNAYVKCFSGKLAPTCGCAIAAGVGASASIVYQQIRDPNTISKAINNVLADIAGILCDGAKSGCSLRVISSVDSAIRSAFFALDGMAVGHTDGIVGYSAEETIKNLGRISMEGMAYVDQVVLDIMASKEVCSRRHGRFHGY